MKTITSISSALACFLLVTFAKAIADSPKAREPQFPDAVMTPWKKEGVQILWVRQDDWGFVENCSFDDAGAWPEFSLKDGARREWTKMPTLERPWGLSAGGAFKTVDFTGISSLKNLRSVGLIGIFDKDLKNFSVLTDLEHLNLIGNPVNGSGLTHLKELPKLRSLQFPFASLTDEGFQSVKELKHLTSLNLSMTKIGDVSLKSVAALSKLTALQLMECKMITDKGVKDLAALKNLTHLDLRCKQITDEGIKSLAVFPKLHTLRLQGTQLTDAGLQTLAGLKSLRNLDIGYTAVTNAGLKQLEGLNDLEKLDWNHSKVTLDAYEALQRKLPKLNR